MSVPIAHEPALHDFPRSCGNSSHSEAALGDLVSARLLCAAVPLGGVQALVSSTMHSHTPPARASVPGHWARLCLCWGQGSQHSSGPGSHLSNLVMKRKKKKKKSNTKMRESRLEAEGWLFCPILGSISYR